MWGMNKQRRNQRDGTWMIPRNNKKKHGGSESQKMALGAKQWKIQRAQILWTIWKSTENLSQLIFFNAQLFMSHWHCIPRALLGDGDKTSPSFLGWSTRVWLKNPQGMSPAVTPADAHQGSPGFKLGVWDGCRGIQLPNSSGLHLICCIQSAKSFRFMPAVLGQL